MDTQRQNPQVLGWENGTNNLTPRARQPQGTARSLVNLDIQSGRLGLRAGVSRVLDASNVRGVLALGRKLLVAAGDTLIEYAIDTDSARELRQIAPAGEFVGDTVNGILYFCTANEALEYDGNAVRRWGVPDVTAQPTVITTTGGLLPGYYKVAVTYTDQWGREGGTDRAVFLNVASGGMTVGPVTVPAGCVANVYVGPNSGSSLYLQGKVQDGGSLTLTQLRDDTARCTTEFMRAPRPGHRVRAIRGVLAVAQGRVVQLTNPFQPHVVDLAGGFIQYPERVGELLADGGLYVSADKCYMVSDVETREVSQRVVLDFPAIPGTGVALPSGRGAWMTRYGQAITTPEGMSLIHRDSYAVDYAEHGAAGVLDYQGNELIVTVMHGRKHRSPLAAK